MNEADLVAETIRLAEEAIRLVKHSQERDWSAHRIGAEQGWHVGAGCWVNIGYRFRDAKKLADKAAKLYCQRADAIAKAATEPSTAPGVEEG